MATDLAGGRPVSAAWRRFVGVRGHGNDCSRGQSDGEKSDCLDEMHFKREGMIVCLLECFASKDGC